MVEERGRNKAPRIVKNWWASDPNQEAPETYKSPLFTDAWITGGCPVFGPYELFNTVAHAGMPENSLKPALVIRIGNYLEDELPNMDQTDVGSYHGGTTIDEIASLVSLALGIRLKAGPMMRQFSARGIDPKGRPVTYYGFGPSSLPRNDPGRSILPSAVGSHSLENLTPLFSLPQLTAQDAIALVRAARLYQESVWIVEADPAYTNPIGRLDVKI